MRALLTLFVLAGISAGVFALGHFRKESDGKPILHVADDPTLTVSVAKPERGEIQRHVQAPGEVEAVLEVDVSSEIVAKIEEMPIEEGDPVKAGDLLCRLDDERLLAEVESAEARVAQLEAMILQTEADLDKAERDWQRQKRLAEADATSANEIADYRTVLKKVRASREVRVHELAQAQAVLRSMRKDLTRTIIESPIDGVVSRLSAKQGEVVVTGTMNNPGTVIMSIADLSRMQVRARVDEVDVPLVQPGQKARIYLQSDQDLPVPARVVRVAAKGSRQQGRDVVSFETILEVLSDDPRIKPGMTANVEVQVAQQADAITVPVEAVLHRLRKDLPDEIVKELDAKQEQVDLSERVRQAQYIKVVFVKEEDVARLRLIEPGIADSWRVEMLGGVGMDDTVIVGPYRSLDQLTDGRKVSLVEPDKKEDEADTPGEEDEDTETRSAEGEDTEETKDREEDVGAEDGELAAANG